MMFRDDRGPGGDAGANSFEITVRQGPDAALALRRVMLRRGSARMRIGFAEAVPPDRVLVPALADALARILAGAGHRAGETRHVDLRLDLAGLIADDCALRLRPAAQGGCFAVIRFGRVLGDPAALLRGEVIAAGGQSAARRGQFAAFVVDRLFLPVANLNHLLDEVLVDIASPRIDHARHALERLRAHTLSLQATLAELVAGNDPRAQAPLMPPADLTWPRQGAD
ncbi:MAG: hypothetical protein D6686_03390 [Alphaproteobacteria bacterium]|nr:MAG: hypothetical protein D6686_03390 [Alphaproteobacteria bacterium]